MLGKWAFTSDEGKVLSVKRNNLKASSLCAKCDQDASKKCQSCGAVSYCSRDCQVAHWKTHKKLCKATTADTASAADDDGSLAPSITLKNGAGGGFAFRDNSISLVTKEAVNYTPSDSDAISKTSNLLPNGRHQFKIKIQAAAERGAGILVYSKDRSFYAIIQKPDSPYDPEPQYAAIRALVLSDEAGGGVRSFYTCEYDAALDTAYITFDKAHRLPMQAW